VIRAAAAALLGAMIAAVSVTTFYTAAGPLRVDFGVKPPPGTVRGFYGTERDAAAGVTFAWTGREAGLTLPGLDRRMPWTLTLRARSLRAGPDAPILTFYVDGVEVGTQQATPGFSEHQVVVPPRPERPGVDLAVRSSSTFVPGGGDRRALGVMVDVLQLSPHGLALPASEILALVMLTGAVLAAATASTGVTSGTAIGSAVLLGAGVAATVSYGFGPYGGFPRTAVQLALGAAIALAIFGRAARGRLRNTARFAVIFSIVACFLELLILLHPNMPIGDALFQAHRFQVVLGGNMYFTSIAPGGYAFPYAPGLYVAALPFAGLVAREHGDVALLRIFTTVADAAVGLLLYAVAARAWRDRLAGAVAVALYHLMPLGYRIITVGNLTNAFAETVAVAALGILCAPWFQRAASPAAALLTVVLAAAFLSHTSTFAILTVCTVSAALLFAWRGGPVLRRAALAAGLSTGAAVAIAIAVYYAHFSETYRSEMARIGAETAASAADAGGRGPFERAAAIPRYLYLYFGVPVLLLAGAGCADRWRRGLRDRLTLALGGWGLACVLFLVLGVLTPVDMRYYLTIIPALALWGGVGGAEWWRAGPPWRAAAALLLAWAVWIGVGTWWSTLQN
jgi:hypothetical protein